MDGENNENPIKIHDFGVFHLFLEGHPFPQEASFIDPLEALQAHLLRFKLNTAVCNLWMERCLLRPRLG